MLSRIDYLESLQVPNYLSELGTHPRSLDRSFCPSLSLSVLCLEPPKELGMEEVISISCVKRLNMYDRQVKLLSLCVEDKNPRVNATNLMQILRTT